MMQDLLAERFGLKVHFESREEPVLAMMLEKPGRPGPKLLPHDKGLSCESKPTKDVFPEICYGFQAMDKVGQMLTGARATPLQLIGSFLGSMREGGAVAAGGGSDGADRALGLYVAVFATEQGRPDGNRRGIAGTIAVGGYA